MPVAAAERNTKMDRQNAMNDSEEPLKTRDASLEELESAHSINKAAEDEEDDVDRYRLVRILLAEALGTCIIVLGGCGSVCSSLSGAYSGIWQVAVVWGVTVALAIYTTAEISGAHLNPAVTLAFLLVRPEAHGMNLKLALQYMVAQLAGGIVGGALNMGIYGSTIAAFERANGITRGSPKSILSASAFGEYYPNPGLSLEWGGGPYRDEDVSTFRAFATEAWGTCVLCIFIFALTHSRNSCAESSSSGTRPGVPVMIGSVVSILLALYAPITQAGWNPARDFGPRIVAAMSGWGKIAIPGPRNGFWIYILGPFVGGPIGAFFSEFILWGTNPKKAQ